jgi:hypothetical protein
VSKSCNFLGYVFLVYFYYEKNILSCKVGFIFKKIMNQSHHGAYLKGESDKKSICTFPKCLRINDLHVLVSQRFIILFTVVIGKKCFNFDLFNQIFDVKVL